MLRKLMRTSPDISAMVMRVALGVVMFPHGAQKVLGWYGGQGLQETLQGFSLRLGIPAPLAWLDIVAEFVGPILLVVGLFGRVAALGIACVMAVAIALVHLPNGFFMNWQGNQVGEGIEYHILALALAVGVMIKGSGLWSLDRSLSKNGHHHVEAHHVPAEEPRHAA